MPRPSFSGKLLRFRWVVPVRQAAGAAVCARSNALQPLENPGNALKNGS